MVYRNPDRREGQSQKGTDYADAIIEFMKARGYLLDSRAEDSGEQEDLVFQPIIGRLQPVVAEAKSRDEDSRGFSPNDYKVGFAERFRAWEEGSYANYDFHIFFENESNQALWKRLFDSCNSEALHEFYDKMVEAVDGDLAEFLSGHDASRFERFAEKSSVWAGYDRADLLRLTERIEESGEYDFNPYLVEYEAVPETGELSTNLLRITSLPETLYRFEAVEGTDTRSFYRYESNRWNPVDCHDGRVYSLLPPDDLPVATLDFLVDEDPETIPFEDWATDATEPGRINSAKSLLRGLLVRFGTELGLAVTGKRRDTRLYAVHGESSFSISNVELTKELDVWDAYRHLVVVIDVEFFAGVYYYSLTPTQDFTSDGENIVSGKMKRRLSADFNPNRFPQNRRTSNRVGVWAEHLSPSESLIRFQVPAPFQELSFERVEGLQLQGLRPPHNGDEQRELIESTLAPARDPQTTADEVQ